MEDNSKLFVFDKKEVVLIFVFTTLIAITAFTLGVRFGKQLSLKQDQYSESDLDIIELKSTEEEKVESLIGSGRETEFESSLNKKETLDLNTDDRLKAELDRLSAPDSSKTEEAAAPQVKEADTAPIDTIQTVDDIYKPQGNFSGKYTIQLAAFDSKDEAQSFADGFIVSGHDAIINEVEIEGKGTWYRVSVGLFDNINMAKEYLEKEKNFFQGKDYIINKLD